MGPGAWYNKFSSKSKEKLFGYDLKEPLKDKDLKDILEPEKPASVKGSSSNMNEFVQTNMKKGIADSAPEAPVNDHVIFFVNFI